MQHIHVHRTYTLESEPTFPTSIPLHPPPQFVMHVHVLPFIEFALYYKILLYWYINVHSEEIFHSQFASRAKTIKNKPVVNEVCIECHYKSYCGLHTMYIHLHNHFLLLSFRF